MNTPVQINSGTLVAITMLVALLLAMWLNSSGALTQHSGFFGHTPSTLGFGIFFGSILLCAGLGITAYTASSFGAGLASGFFGLLAVLLLGMAR